MPRQLLLHHAHHRQRPHLDRRPGERALPLLFPSAPFPFQGAAGINSRAQVVGYAADTNGSSGFLFQDGKIYDVNDLLAAPSPWRIADTAAINDQGWIAANALTGTGVQPVLLIPVD